MYNDVYLFLNCIHSFIVYNFKYSTNMHKIYCGLCFVVNSIYIHENKVN